MPQFKKLKYYDGFILLQTSQLTQAIVNHLYFSNWSTTCWMPEMFLKSFNVSTITLTALGSQPLRIPVLCNWSLLETKSCVCQFRIFITSSILPQTLQGKHSKKMPPTGSLLFYFWYKQPERTLNSMYQRSKQHFSSCVTQMNLKTSKNIQFSV